MKFILTMLPLFDLTLPLNGFPIKEVEKKLAAILVISEDDYGSFLEKFPY